MIAMPFHPSNVYTIDDVRKNLKDVLHDVEQKALVSLDGAVDYSLQDKVIDGKLYVDQGIIAGCAGGGFENICAAADIIKGHYIGSDEFTFSVYPASTPIYMELVKNGAVADLMEAGTIVKTAFCGPCFGAGDTPANNAFSIRHSTRNFPNREGSKLQSGQIASVALMDARSIAATAANKGFLTPATDMDVEYKGQKYHFDQKIYANRVFDSHGVADPDTKIKFGPNIKDWPAMSALPENLVLKVVSEIHDPVTTTADPIWRNIFLQIQSTWTGRVCTFQKRSCICGTCKGSAESTESNRSRRMSVRGIGRIKTGYGKDPGEISGSRKRKYRSRKYDLCSKTR